MSEVLEPEVKYDAFDLDKPVIPEAKQSDAKPLADAKVEPKIDDKPDVEDGRKYLKERLNYDDWDIAKKDIDELKSRAQTPAEIKYANERSKQLALAIQSGKMEEAYQILDKEVKLSKLTSGDITEENAAAIIKAQIKEKYDLKDDQVEYRFNKLYGTPKEPVYNELKETEDDFAERHADWKQKVEDTKMEMLIEAKIVRPELEKLKSELKYPEVPQAIQTEREPTPEELELAKKNVELFVQNADEAVKNFDGFNVDYKDKDVHIKSNYKLSDEEQSNVKGALKLLAESNYNSNAIFAQRWVNDDDTFNFSQMVKDLATLESVDKSVQKFVGDAANKAKVQFIKDKHNIDLGKDSGGQLQLEDKEAQKKNEDAIWGL